MANIAIYTRLSLDDTKQQTATARQEAHCRAYAKARDWHVVAVHEDVDFSAYRKGVIRPAYEKLRDQVAAGTVDGVLVWKLDRLARRPAEFERFWSVCETSGAFLASVTEPVDSSTEIGLAIVRVLITFAGLESSTSSLRLRAKAREIAESGRAWSGHRPFGHTPDWQAVVPEEADAIRDAARRILKGESLSSIARDWDDRGIKTTTGRAWPTSKLMPMLCSARIVGDRSWHGTEIVATDCFPAILDRTTHLRLRRLASARRATGRNDVHPSLLAGLLICGECGHRLYSRRGGMVPTYSCPARPNGCSHIHLAAASADPWVVEQAFARLREQPPPMLLRRQPNPGLYRALVERLEELDRDYHMHQTMTRASYLTCRAAIDEELTRHAARSGLPQAEGLPRGFDIRHADTAWAVLSMEHRRAFLQGMFASITVHRATQRGKFKPERLTIKWRSDPHLAENVAPSHADSGISAV